MTVIVFDGQYLAADRQATYNDTKFPTTKLHILSPYSAVAFAGNSDYAGELLEWFKNGMKKKDYPQMTEDTFVKSLYVENGELYFFDRTPYPVKIEQSFYAIGSGGQAALGLLNGGQHNALETVELVSEMITSCGLGVDYYEVKIKKPTKKNKNVSQRRKKKNAVK